MEIQEHSSLSKNNPRTIHIIVKTKKQKLNEKNKTILINYPILYPGMR